MDTMKRLFSYAKKIFPRISQTERIALTCGTIGFDRTIFSGKGNLDELKNYKVRMTSEEELYLNTRVNSLCKMIDSEDIRKKGCVPLDIMKELRDIGIFGMLVPKKYGGLDFNTHARSQIVQKISSKNGAVGVVSMVPNSLGPAELLIHYGTKAQRDYFLPKLASGAQIPCFGLTSWAAGSDAAGSMIDTGVVRKTLGGKNNPTYIELTVNKRYITLAPIADLVGLAFKLEDPDGLLNEGTEGITVAILEKEKYPELDTSMCHNPLGAGFPNGTVKADKIRVEVSSIIGGEKMAGSGWKMLMECLSEGRAVSLPATAVSASKTATIGALAYSRVRKQFRTPLYKMEGVAEKLFDMSKDTITITAAQFLTNAIIDAGEKPSVLSAVMKQQTTERARNVINGGMDILGGGGICLGDNNFLGGNYTQAPIGITVEGSNTLTRSLIIFGQGLMRSHPYLLNIVESIEEDDKKKFYKNVFKLVSDSFSQTLGCLTPILDNNRKVELRRLTSSFFLASNVMLLLGKRFKTSEMLSGRYADIFGNIYLAYSVLWFRDYILNDVTNNPDSYKEIDLVLNTCIDSLLYEIQESFYEIADNYPNNTGLISTYIRMISFPYGRRYIRVSDNTKKEVIDILLNNSRLQEILKENIYIGPSYTHLGKLVSTLDICEEELPLETIEELCQVDEFVSHHPKLNH